MTGNKVRELAYKYAVQISAFLAVVIVVGIHLFSPVPSKLSDKPSLVTISVTLAGFLFTGQGIMLALPTSNRFMQLVKEHGYLDDFHKLCRWAEAIFILSVIFSLEIISGLFANQSLANLLYLITFLWPLFMAFWALWIFSNVIALQSQ